MATEPTLPRIWRIIADYSLMLIAGAAAGLIWANLDSHSYHALLERPLWSGGWTLHYLINDALMALFFAMAGKEVWEAVALKDGALRGARAVTPLIATAGGMVGPVLVYLGLAALLGSATWEAMARGWAVPTATDIAFSYLVGRLVFGAGHPAIRFLLLLAIADDAGGLLILAVFYPSAALQPLWLLASVAVALAAFGLFNALPLALDRRRGTRAASRFVRERLSVWPWVAAGLLSWLAFAKSGIHPALGLLPIVPAIPHADREFGLFAEAEGKAKDLLNVLEHRLSVPVDFVLFAFGFANAGVELAAVGSATWLVLLGLMVGKPLGIWAASVLALKIGLKLPVGMRLSDTFVLGAVAGIGFTVALFVASVAFPPGPVQDGAKMGALLSLLSAGVALAAGRYFRIERRD
jgi:NhaA family Na+:H+ antiporter